MSDAYGMSPNDVPSDEELGLIPDRVRCRHELREWMMAILQARELAETLDEELEFHR